MKVIFKPIGVTKIASDGDSLLEVAAKAGIELGGSCNGNGSCGKCKVLVSGNVLPFYDVRERKYFTKSEIDSGYRLACRCLVQSDITVTIPSKDNADDRKTKLPFFTERLEHSHHLKKYCISMKSFHLEGRGGDAEHILQELNHKAECIHGKVLLTLPSVLSKGKETITATVRNQEVIDVEQGERSKECYGIAFDIGTTTVVGMLWNLHTDSFIGMAARSNPQSVYGADVISRIQYADREEKNVKELQLMVMDCCHQIINQFVTEYSIQTYHIYEAVVVCNTTMSHLFLGINPSQLAKSPFRAVFCNEVNMCAKALYLNIHPLANVHLMPNIAGHVGSDITSGILVTKILEEKGLQLFIDVGTNGEIVLSKEGKALACSVAAGPAFEGASIFQGMRAASGAIEKVLIEDGNVMIKTIDEKEAIGICGSGLIDAIAQMLLAGVIEPNGRMLSMENAIEKGVNPKLSERLKTKEYGNVFVLFENEKGESIVITQKDVREVQLAKGAIYGGIMILLSKIGAVASEIHQITIAGAFGNFIDKKSALRMGLFPKIEVDKIISVGNAAGLGASMALLSIEQRNKAKEICKAIEHVELSTCAEFQKEYLKAMTFPKEVTL